MESETHQVRPDTPFEAQYPLSPCDLQVPPVFTGKAFIYFTDELLYSSSPKGLNLVHRLQHSLASFLRHPSPGILAYPQLLGQIVQPTNGGRPHVAVKESFFIPFKVVNRPDIKFSDLHQNGHFPVEAISLADFKVGLDRASLMKSPDSSQNFAIQLTFIDGGFVLLVQVAHQLTDASGFAGFIRHWFQRARDGSATVPQLAKNPESTLAIHDKSTLFQEYTEGRTDGLKKLEAAYRNAQTIKKAPIVGSSERVGKIFWISPPKLEELRAAWQAESTKRPTIFESIVALLWRCILRTRLHYETDPLSKMSKAFFVTNMRQRLIPQLPQDFFGNSVTWVFTSLSLSTLFETKSNSVINTVQKVLQEDITELNLRLTNQFISRQTREFCIGPPMELMGYDVLFNSWEHFYPNLTDLDIGLGNFCTMRRVTDSIVPSLILILPSYGSRLCTSENTNPYEYPGGIEVQVHLFSDQMERLQKDPGWLQYAIIT